MSVTSPLPIYEVLPAVREALAAHPLVVLQAPPGAGKSTALPGELLQEAWLAGQGIVVLQPRRVAARAVATRLAQNIGGTLGETVGYRVRFESRVSGRTRVTVMTEGVLTRQLQGNPELPGVGLVIFDEFHERSLQADLSLALVREVQEALRPDLKVLIMSATLDPALPVRLGSTDSEPVPLIASEGRAYPVQVRYLPTDPTGTPDDAVVAAVSRALDEYEGDILAFLPGVGEIRRALAALSARHPDLTVLPLYGDLSLEAQQRAILPGPSGQRRVILATSIAETSLTIAGVRVVIDGGWTRRQRFDPGTGLSRLVTVRVTHDASVQRAGRAGRTAPGVALRLWSERTQAALSASAPPEILEADLAGLTLELAGWGTPDPSTLHWLDAPPQARVDSARMLLRELDALTPDGRATLAGLKLLSLPTHPRLAHLLLGGADLGLSALAADVAALLEERDPLQGSGSGPNSDLSERLDVLRRWRNRQAAGGDMTVLERVERLARNWRQALNAGVDNSPADGHDAGRLVALAYPERVAALREGTRDRYLMAGGQGVRLQGDDPLAGTPLLAVAHLDARMVAGEGRVYLAAPLRQKDLVGRVTQQTSVRWDARTGTLLAQSETRLGAILLGAEPLKTVPAELRVQALLGAVRLEGLGLLRWTDAARQWQARVSSLRAWRGEDWPDLSDAALLEQLEDWLPPALKTARSREDLGRIDVLPALATLLPWSLTRLLGELAPPTLDVPSGSKVRLEYRLGGEAPILAVKLQELFGLADTPAVNAGRTPVLLHLLSPARRPVQVTQDLRSFWQKGYFEARKDLRGQYPRHPWPDDPWTAEATRKAKPKGT